MDRELEKIPGVLWNFSQPIADNMEEAVSGVKGELAIKVYGDDLKLLEQKGDEIVNVMKGIRGVQDLGLFRVIGQPNLNLEVDRQAAARYQINVADVQDAIQTAAGGNAVSQVLQGEQRYDLVLRYQAPYRDTQEAIENIRLLAPSGERVSLAQLCNVHVMDGASEIYREANSRYVAIKYSVRGRDLGSTMEEAIRKVGQSVKLPTGYRIDWAGEYASQQRSQKRLAIVLPITILVIFIILYTMFQIGTERQTTNRIPDRLGRRIRQPAAIPEAAGDRAPHHHPGDFHHPLYDVSLVQVGIADAGEHCHGAARRVAGAPRNRNSLQRLVGRRVPGAVRGVRANRSHHAGVHQPAPRARSRHCRRGGGRGGPAAPAYHDDHPFHRRVGN